ncbi:saccharopine dehydrogenase family protein [Micromonospora okii]|uniref:saccharopine dehydrogenase family protein n=1 Tax=Micromonospora okii TaxID=1182970 RepID=UPI001E339DF7|nr:saccharopine dehydrogenase C-terminal domain-containing protein [Micromonospora okii]
MRAAQFGCGKMGVGAAYALATDPATTRLTLVDRDRSRAEEAARLVAPHSACRIVVSADPEAAIAGQDVLTLALPWAATRQVVEHAASGGTPLASITRPPVDQLATLDAVARAGGAPLLLPVGLEPGLTELLAASLAERLDHTAAVEIFCGGIPREPREPIGHVTFFGGESAHHLPIAQREAYAATAGRVVTLPRFSGLEQRSFPGVGTLQAYHDGMVPWLCDHPALRAADCTQKTVRWPGFGEAVTELARLGLLAEEPVDLDGTPVTPRRLTERVLAPQLSAGPQDSDVVVLDVAARGTVAGRPAHLHVGLRDAHDPATGLSAMARTTGFTLAAAGALLAEGAVGGAGWLMPHRAIGGAARERLFRSLARRGITITRTPDPQPQEETR